MSYTYLKYNIVEDILLITLNYPQRKNILDNFVVSELLKAFTEAQRDTRVKVIILKSTGDAFSIGIDEAYLKYIAQNDFTQNMEEATLLMKLFEQIYTIRKPVIALIQGPALSHGFGLALACDVIISAEETAFFGFTETKLGLAPAISSIYLSRRIGEGKAKEFIIAGKTINAVDALRLGIINEKVPLKELDNRGLKYAKDLIINNSLKSISLIKELFNRIYSMSTIDALEFACNINTLACMNDEFKKYYKEYKKSEE